MIHAWHFVAQQGRLRDGTPYSVGEPETFGGEIVMCRSGLHASRKAIDALGYAPGNIARRVVYHGEVEECHDKLVGRHRTALWEYDATVVLRHFARLCALDVVHLWDAPDVVVRYLRTGDESLRDAARDAARAAARDAAWEAARAAAWEAARAAARDAAWAAAWDAAWAAARAAARDAQDRRLHRMLLGGRR